MMQFFKIAAILTAFVASSAGVQKNNLSELFNSVRGSYGHPSSGSAGGATAAPTTTATTSSTSTTNNPDAGAGDDTSGDEIDICNMVNSQVNEAALYELNKYRELHGSQPLVFKKDLVQYAEKAAAYYAKEETAVTLEPRDTSNPFKCKPVKKYSEAPDNVGIQFAIICKSGDPILVMDSTATRWYKRKDASTSDNGNGSAVTKYDFDDPDVSALWAYSPFTQMIWNNTGSVGCAFSALTSSGKTRICVCAFEDVGNILVDSSVISYIKNVKRA